MSGLYEVTVLIQGQTVTGKPVPAEGALEVRRYAAMSEEHARESATLGLTDTEEIVSVSAPSTIALDDQSRARAKEERCPECRDPVAGAGRCPECRARSAVEIEPGSPT